LRNSEKFYVRNEAFERAKNGEYLLRRTGLQKGCDPVENSRDIQQLLLAPVEAAKVLSVSTRTLWSMTNAGELPAIKVRNRWRYPVEALERWIAQQAMARAVKL